MNNGRLWGVVIWYLKHRGLHATCRHNSNVHVCYQQTIRLG